jgi:hypothetical protein
MSSLSLQREEYREMRNLFLDRVTVHGPMPANPKFVAKCRLSLRESSAAFAERKATFLPQPDIAYPGPGE